MRTRINSGRAARITWLAVLVAIMPLASAEAGRVRGKVVDREGKPAPGAKVWAAKLTSWSPLEVSEALTDASGEFAIEAGLSSWLVFALRGDEGGRAGWNALATVEAGKDPAPVTIHLNAPSTLRGRLIDAETGRPVPGGRFALDDGRRVEVDARGRFQAPGLELAYHEAYPLCPGYERRRILFDTTGRPDAELDLRLPAAGKVVGRVVDSAGQPIPGASVGVVTSGSILSGTALWERCSDDGRFSYDGKPLGRSGRLSGQAPGYQSENREDVVALVAADPVEVVFTLQLDPTKAAKKGAAAVGPPHRSVAGTVTGPGGGPVASAVVRWGLRMDSKSLPQTTTDASGGFRLEGVPESAEVLSVMAKGLAPSFPPVEAGGDQRIKVDLKAGATIRGRVVDDSGSPVEGVSVSPQVPIPKPNYVGRVYLDELTARTDRDGRFTLEGMPAGFTCDLVAEGHSSLRQKTFSATDEAQNVVTLLGEGAIRGRVVDPAGFPVRNFRIKVGIPKGAKPGEPVGGYFAGYTGTGIAFTRADGEFTITRLTAGNVHRLTVFAGQFGSGEAERVEAQSLGRLKPAETLTIKLGLPHSLRVRVIQPGGIPLEGARVTAIQGEGQRGFQWGMSDGSWDDSVTAVANDQGWAEFPALGFGGGEVVVRAKGFSRTRIEWAKAEPEFEVMLQPESKITGTVLDDAGKPIPGSRITLSWGRGESMSVAVDPRDGRYVADGLAEGKYRMTVMSGGTPRSVPALVDLGTGQTLSKDLQIETPKPPVPAGP